MSTSWLKLIACIAMALDHVGYLMQAHSLGDIVIASWFRLIGRMAFPIFAFLITEGFKKTKNVVLYALRLFIAGIISEIPYNLCFGGGLVDRGSLNVMFSLTIALIALVFADMSLRSSRKEVRFLFVIPIISACYIANKFGVDYGYWGIILIFLFYIIDTDMAKRKLMMIPVVLLFACRKVLEDFIFSGSVGSWSKYQLFALLSLIPLLLYNGKLGKNKGGSSKLKKYSFYLFYPAHLIVLWLIFSNIHLLLN